MNKRLLSVVKYLLILSVGVALLWLAFRGVSLTKTIDNMLQANFFWLFVSIAASLVAFVSRAIRWNMLIEPLGYKPSVTNTSAALMIGYLANLAVPRLGEVTRCGTLSRTEKVPFDSLLGTVIIERIIDVLCLLALIFLVAIIEFNRLGNLLIEKIYHPITEKIAKAIHSPLFIGVLISLIAIIFLYFFFRKKNTTGTFSQKFTGILRSVFNGIDTIRKLKSPLGFLFHTILIWFMYFLMSYTCFFALKETSLLGWHAGLFVLVAGGIGMSAPVQGGLGAYHMLVSEGLMLYGVENAPSLTFATLMHTSQTLVVIILGSLAFLYLFLKRRNAKNQHN
jgi:glycosyltransferase 2 family protein